ncbi:hypothetical protein M8818_006157 [Zalaria obscura]|uniref:Uncharacterized protein n=1 Tax=Zalaria obscura TaxID=2024903 RepID=A0ACC3S7Q1_9PEZI
MWRALDPDDAKQDQARSSSTKLLPSGPMWHSTYLSKLDLYPAIASGHDVLMHAFRGCERVYLVPDTCDMP